MLNRGQYGHITIITAYRCAVVIPSLPRLRSALVVSPNDSLAACVTCQIEFLVTSPGQNSTEGYLVVIRVRELLQVRRFWAECRQPGGHHSINRLNNGW